MRYMLLLLTLPMAALADSDERACCRQDIRTGTSFSYTGTVVEVDYEERDQEIHLQTADGMVHEIDCVGPARFWRDLGLSRPRVGDKITVEGHRIQCDPDDYENAASRIIIGDQTVRLRNADTGRPLWL